MFFILINEKESTSDLTDVVTKLYINQQVSSGNYRRMFVLILNDYTRLSFLFSNNRERERDKRNFFSLIGDRI